jgi:probable HAF family extracellular repeat protein
VLYAAPPTIRLDSRNSLNLQKIAGESLPRHWHCLSLTRRFSPMMRRYIAAVTLGVLFAAVPMRQPLQAATGPVYTVTDLGSMNGVLPTITGLNASGQLSGYVPTGGARAVRYTNGVWSSVPGLENTFSVATGINASGDISGYEFTSAGALRGFVYVNGTSTPIVFGVLTGGSMSLAMGINDSGTVVGYSDETGGITAGWVASAAAPALSPLPTLDGGSSPTACGINNRGAVVGSVTTAAGAQHAYRLNLDGSVDDVGSLEQSGSTNACAIDSNGRVGGAGSVNTLTHAIRFDAGAPVDIDSFGSTSSMVAAVSAGISVGSYQISGENRAFVQSGTDTAADLNTLLANADGWVLSEALAINSNGAIAGDGLLNGVAADFLLTPSKGDTTPPTISAISASPSTIVPPNGAMVPVTVSVTATDNADPSPVCSIDSITASGSTAANSSIAGPLTGSVRAASGATYTFNVTCADASGNQAHSSASVVVPPDTTAPVISGVTASPSTIWPPRGQMVTVTIAVTATDDSGVAPACSLSGITGPGTPGVDYVVTGQFTGSVAAVGGRTYSFTAHCIDGAGNGSTASVNAVVPRDTAAPVIVSVSATPSNIWPPDNKMVNVSVSVSATDNVDASPACALSAVSGSPANAAMTGRFSASVRASNGSVYVLTVTCTDTAGNKTSASTSVAVTKDPPSSSTLKSNHGLIEGLNLLRSRDDDRDGDGDRHDGRRGDRRDSKKDHGDGRR